MDKFRVKQKKGKEVINQMIVNDLGLTKSLVTIYGDDVKKVLFARNKLYDGESLTIKYRGFTFNFNKLIGE